MTTRHFKCLIDRDKIKDCLNYDGNGSVGHNIKHSRAGQDRRAV